MVQRMIQGDPQSLDANVWKVRVLRQNGKDREAEVTLNTLVQQKPEDPNPWIQLMMFHIASREPAKAKATFESMRKQVKIDPSACRSALGGLLPQPRHA